MKNGVVIFIVSLVIGVGLGFLFNQGGATNDVAGSDASSQLTDASESPAPAEDSSEEATADAEPTATVPAEAEIIQSKGCLSCHAVSGLNLNGGATGPDLSDAYNEVEGKHGKPLNEFLKEPTSAVMSSVIGGNPLTDEEIKKIVEALKLASESK